MDRVNGWAEVLQRLGDVEGNIPARLFIHRRCGRLVETLPSLQHDPSRPEDVLKVDADGEGVGRDDAADALGIWWRRKRLEAGNYALSGLGWLRGRYSQGVALGYRMAPRWGAGAGERGWCSWGVAPGYRMAPRWGGGWAGRGERAVAGVAEDDVVEDFGFEELANADEVAGENYALAFWWQKRMP
ncbi:MAG TPA: hypothetical protein PLV05_04225 [Verrucomicrobiota bacterium]|mgnify:FL=1|nr:hypothetical protein [Verrucomicrobiota bacterium]HRR64505.1 hypothetical protein [Candidatus Paceibacterota bacterium]MBP8014313.1 hypothetical protein [Verrucomicrobiota bacterium]NLH86368.1 hypothetical protein [Verrucomicrobiota bacterium]HNR71313.1 hypothetical protein [Verrucomicrobiota bacterium]